MPELPEVEAARKIADGVVTGRVIVRARAVEDEIVFEGVSARTVKRRLEGRRVIGTDRRGKHMWLKTEGGPDVLFHLGMTGAFVTDDPGRFVKLALELDDGGAIYFVNKRRLGRVRFRDDALSSPPVNALGPDPLFELPTAAALGRLLAPKRAPIKALLLDQRLFAGIGNWIADEVLYQARLAPGRRAHTLQPAEVKRLRAAIKKVIERAVAVDADKDRFPRGWLFHVRWGKDEAARTPRGERVVFDTIGGRTTAWVPARQS